MSNLKDITEKKAGKNDNGKVDFKHLNNNLKNKKKSLQPGRVVLKK